jgi:ferrous-iron efflux pump FieF
MENNKYNNERAKKLKKIAAVSSVSVAVILAVCKIIVAFMTGSLAILSSMIDSLADIGASCITLISINFSSMPPTKKHRYGHGKAEALSALAQSGFIGGSGCFIVYDIVYKLIYSEPIVVGKLGIAVMVFCFILTLCLVLFQSYVIKITKSQAIIADSVHYKGDLISAFVVVIALCLIEYVGLSWIDPIVAAFVAGYLLLNAYKVGKNAINVLMDIELSDEVRKEIKDLVLSNNFVTNIHDLRTRDAGVGSFIEFHLELDGNISLEKAHVYSHIVENQLHQKISNAQIVIHQEPAGLKDDRLDNIINK